MLSLRIFDEIEVATIATDKTTILEIRRSHSTSMKFDNVSLSMTAKKSAKKCTACSKFCLLINFGFVFSRFPHCPCRGCSTSQTHSRYKTISLKNRRFDEKRVTKATSPGTHETLKGLSLKTCIKKKKQKTHSNN